jgi:methylmalonyl-CoA mutase N-terminal domain/subunit
LGGALAAIEQGYIQHEIQEAAYRYQRAVESGDQAVVGVNRFESDTDAKPTILRVDESIREQQLHHLAALRTRRDAAAVTTSLNALAVAATGTENLLPFILTAVEAYATTGEICHTLRRVWGEYLPGQEM